MTHQYTITGMTCTGCEAKVKNLLSQVEGVENVSIDLAKGEATITMHHHIPVTVLQESLKDYPKYQLTGTNERHQTTSPLPEGEATKSWLALYKPLLLIFAYITGISLLVEAISPAFDWMRWMNHFMAGFFLVFSFFKLLDLEGFADSYTTYDIVARRWKGWAYVYAFTELGLGILLLSGIQPLLTNVVIFVVMGISIIGVLQSVLNKRKIRCACLGAVFNLPMSTVTILEDALMIAMSGTMLATMIWS